MLIFISERGNFAIFVFLLVVLGIIPRSSHMLEKRLISELHPQPGNFIL
jgi:hypothetical protein